MDNNLKRLRNIQSANFIDCEFITMSKFENILADIRMVDCTFKSIDFFNSLNRNLFNFLIIRNGLFYDTIFKSLIDIIRKSKLKHLAIDYRSAEELQLILNNLPSSLSILYIVEKMEKSLILLTEMIKYIKIDNLCVDIKDYDYDLIYKFIQEVLISGNIKILKIQVLDRGIVDIRLKNLIHNGVNMKLELLQYNIGNDEIYHPYDLKKYDIITKIVSRLKCVSAFQKLNPELVRLMISFLF
jgi:hypothetical protein